MVFSPAVLTSFPMISYITVAESKEQWGNVSTSLNIEQGTAHIWIVTPSTPMIETPYNALFDALVAGDELLVEEIEPISEEQWQKTFKESEDALSAMALRALDRSRRGIGLPFNINAE